MFLTTTYLATQKGFSTESAGYITTLFSVSGVVGTFVGSFLSDTLFRSRRAPISVIMLLILSFCLFLFWKAEGVMIPISISLGGFFVMGPDFLVSAVAVMDFGSKEGAGTAAGFVNGVGSFGPAVMGVTTGLLVSSVGWNGVFIAIIILSLLCAALMSTLWKKVGKN